MLKRSPTTEKLTEEQKRVYEREKTANFRWLLNTSATRSPRVLSSTDIAPPEVKQEISEIGQFAELAHGSINPENVWANLPKLLEPGFPLENYTFLAGSKLIRAFIGSVSSLQGYCAYRPQSKQLFLTFSGTSSKSQSFQNVKSWRIVYPRGGDDCKGASVHAGFWDLYWGIRDLAFQALEEGLLEDVQEVVFTGHSMGCVMASYMVFELLDPTGRSTTVHLPPDVRLKLVTFGSPRFANLTMVDCWRRRVEAYRSSHGAESFQQWSVKAYNDGVPSLPSTIMGFAHVCDNPFYFRHSTLYCVPPSEKEYSIFNVEKPAASSSGDSEAPVFPRGGHNYYSDRDIEKLQRLLRWATEHGLGRTNDWPEALLRKVKEEDQKWEAQRGERQPSMLTKVLGRSS